MISKSLPLAVLAAGLALPQAVQAETKVLKYSHMWSPSHYAWAQAGKPFTEKVTELTGGSVTFEVYPSGQLGKDYISQLDTGLADVTGIIGSYAADKIPLTSVSELPQRSSGPCETSARLWSLVQPGGRLYEAEYKPNGLHPLFAAVLPSYKILTTKKQLTGYEDLKGLKIRASGAAMEDTARALGAVPIPIQGPDMNDALMRGTVDGTILTYSSALAYGLEPLVKYSLNGVYLGSTSVVYAISEQTWAELSAEEQAAFITAGREVQASFCAWMHADEAVSLEKMTANAAHQPTSVSPEKAEEWQATLESVSRLWAGRLDGLKRDGAATLEAYRAMAVQ